MLRDGSKPLFECINGEAPWVFAAPHGLAHYRVDGSYKPGEPCTAEVAIMLAERLGAAALVQSAAVPMQSQMSSRLSERFASCTLLDFHGMADSVGFDVCIGTGPIGCPKVQRLAQLLKERFEKENLSVSMNEPFSGAPPWTLTHDFQKSGGVAVQLEFARRGRPLRYYGRLVELIGEVISQGF